MKHPAPILASAVCGLLIVASDASAQYAYPAKGQSASRQAKDEAECSRWATGRTGYDPARPPVVATAEAAPVTGSQSRLRGAAAGAVIGGVSGGSVAGGAAAGAVVGGVSRRVRNRREARAQNAAATQQVQATQASYAQARGACLTGRGYSVK